MIQDGIKGFVVGPGRMNGKSYWVVRVKDNRYPSFNRKKYKTYSMCDGSCITQKGQNVIFSLEEIFITHQDSEIVAVNVNVVSSGKKNQTTTVEKFQGLTIDLYMEESDGEHFVYTTGCKTEEEAQAACDENGSNFAGFISFSANDLRETHDGSNIQAGFQALEALCYVEDVRDALEQLLTVVYKLGVKPGEVEKS